AGGLITRPAESHRQRPELASDVGSRPEESDVMASLLVHGHRPNRRRGWLILPGSPMNSSIRPVSSGSPSLSIQEMQLQSPSPLGKPYEYWLYCRSRPRA